MITKTGFTFEYKGKTYGMNVVAWDTLSIRDKKSLYKDTKLKMIALLNEIWKKS